ncbi:MAG: DUF1648 domain-containing protein [Planctomycetaceae bacterium]
MTMAQSGRLAFRILLLLVPVGILQHSWYWYRLPESVATHFGPGGQADNWMPRLQAVLVQAGFQVVFPFVMLLLGRLTYVLPVSMINIPWREYWLQEDRRSDSLAWMSGMLSWISVGMSLLMLVLSHLTFQANMTRQPLQMVPFFCLLGMFMTFVFSMVLLSFRRFSRPPS